MIENSPPAKKSFFGKLAAAFIILMKSSKIIAALKLLKFGKPLIVVASLLVSTVIYGWFLGPLFGVGLVVMIFIHEMGHIIALRIKGFETPGPVFIPFLGAAIFIKDFGGRDNEAFIGIGGPILGTLGAVVCLLLSFMTEGKTAEVLMLVSYVGIFLNLFNLIPISPLDGGRITQAVGPWFKYVGMALLLGYTFMTMQPALLLIWILVLGDFNRMPLWLRPSLGILITLVMTALMIAGYSHQPEVIDILDMGIAMFFTVMFISLDRRRSTGNEIEIVDQRPYPSKRARMKWLVSYLALALFTTGVIVYQMEHMPDGVKTHSEQLPSPQIQ